MMRLAFGIFATILGFAFLLLAPSVPAQSVNADQAGRVCPLSDNQQNKAQQSFATLASMVKGEPRCNNCHGAVDPFADGTSHLGGRQDPIMDDNTGKLDVLASRVGQCSTCHDSPWQVPQPDDFFTDKNAVQLCQHFRSHFQTANGFMKHMEDDDFSLVGFKGTRGLNEHGISVYEDATQQSYAPIPPKFSHGQLVGQSQEWVDAMGGKFQGDQDCGCVPHHYALDFTDTGIIDVSTGGVRTHLDGHGEQAVPMIFNDDGSFHGSATLMRSVAVTATAFGEFCLSSGEQPNRIEIAGQVDDQGMLHAQANWSAPDVTFNLTCTGNISLSRKSSIPGFNSNGVQNPLHTGFDLHAFVGQQMTFPINVQGAQFTYTVKIVQLD